MTIEHGTRPVNWQQAGSCNEYHLVETILEWEPDLDVETHEAGLQPSILLNTDVPGALPQAGIKRAFGAPANSVTCYRPLGTAQEGRGPDLYQPGTKHQEMERAEGEGL